MEYDGEHITYYRTKTKGRRNDHAKMVVRVHPFIKPLMKKYKGKNRVFNFCERFFSMGDLNRSINIGLKEIGKEIGVESKYPVFGIHVVGFLYIFFCHALDGFNL